MTLVRESELHYQNIEPPLCWQEVFHNTWPVVVEIGFGKCGFLIDIASQQSATNFVGIESSRKYYLKGIKKIERAKLQNVKLMWGEAFHIFNRSIPDHSLSAVYVNFPDPWPKRRHAKRRLIRAEFTALTATKIVPAGIIELSTDAEFYMDDARRVFDADETYELVSYTTSDQEHHSRPYKSDYEKMFLQEGRTIYCARYRKT